MLDDFQESSEIRTYVGRFLSESWSSFESASGLGGGDGSRGRVVAGGSAVGLGVDGFDESLLPLAADSVEAEGGGAGVLGSEPGVTGVFGNRSERSVYWLNCSTNFFLIAIESSSRPA